MIFITVLKNFLQNTFKNHSFLNYILYKGGISIMLRASGTFLGFLIMWLIIRYFSNALYGGFVIIQTLIQLGVIVFTLGIQNVLIFEFNKPNFNSNKQFPLLLKSYKLTLIVGILPILLIFFFSDFISQQIFNKPQLLISLKYASLGLLIFVFHDITLYYFIAKKKIIHFGLFMFIIPNIIFLLLMIIYNNRITELHQLVYYYLIAFSVTLIIEIGIILLRDYSKEKSSVSVKNILNYSLPMMLSSMTIYLLSWTDVLMLGMMTSETDVGIYNTAFKIGFFVLVFVIAINVVVAPKVAEYYQKNDPNSLKSFINQVTQLITLITLPVVIGIILFRNQLLGIFGIDFLQGSTVLIIIAIATLINSATGNVDQILNMTKNQKLLFKINIVSLIINIAFNAVLIPYYGINGAATASLISTVFMNIAALYFIKKKLGFYTFY